MELFVTNNRESVQRGMQHGCGHHQYTQKPGSFRIWFQTLRFSASSLNLFWEDGSIYVLHATLLHYKLDLLQLMQYS